MNVSSTLSEPDLLELNILCEEPAVLNGNLILNFKNKNQFYTEKSIFYHPVPAEVQFLPSMTYATPRSSLDPFFYLKFLEMMEDDSFFCFPMCRFSTNPCVCVHSSQAPFLRCLPLVDFSCTGEWGKYVLYLTRMRLT